jgi:hypothetical protein
MKESLWSQSVYFGNLKTEIAKVEKQWESPSKSKPMCCMNLCCMSWSNLLYLSHKIVIGSPMNLNSTSTPTMLLLLGCKRRASLWYCHLIKLSSSKGLTCNQQEKNVRI